MPTFDFHCKACNAVFEAGMTFGAKTKPACPSCKSRNTEKQFSVPGVVFKGTGFYKTDSRAPHKEKSVEKAIKPKAEPKKTEGTKDSK